MPKVSVIIPVYGVEKYIERCARNLFEQTLDDIEFIFVDDCTPDRSMEILSQIIEEYRLRFAEKNYVARTERMPTNSGLPAVRRHGIQLCTGDYIIHCDSDDWVDKSMFEKLYSHAVKYNCDIVVCGYQETDGKNIIRKGNHKFQTKEEYISNMLLMKETWAVWDKLCSRELYKGYEPPQYAMGEDLVITLQLVLKSGNIGNVEEVLYNYFFNPSSITKVKTDEKRYNNWKQSIANASRALGYISQYGLENKFATELIFLKYRQKKLLGNLAIKKKYSKEWIDCFAEINGRCLSLKNLTFIEKIKFLITLVIAHFRESLL